MKGNRRFLDPQQVADLLNVSEGMQIADLGCGTGHLVLALARKVGPEGRIFAVDIDPEMISSARAYVNREGLRNVDFLIKDIVRDELAELPSQQLDIIFMSNVLHELGKDKTRAVESCLNLLKPDGKLVIVEWKRQKTLFGPRLDARLTEDETKKLGGQGGFVFEQAFEAGIYHYGLIFFKATKPVEKKNP